MQFTINNGKCKVYITFFAWDLLLMNTRLTKRVLVKIRLITYKEEVTELWVMDSNENMFDSALHMYRNKVSLRGSRYAFRYVGKKPTKSIIVTSMMESVVLCTNTQIPIATSAPIKHITSNKAIFFVPYLKQRRKTSIDSSPSAAVPSALHA
jgi:hypothetical protein